MTKAIICFGETFGEVLPTGRQPGGAPFNVAVQPHHLSQPVQFISRVGTDESGTELLAFLAGRGLSTACVQRGHTHLTGVVKANVDNCSELTYKMVQPRPGDRGAGCHRQWQRLFGGPTHGRAGRRGPGLVPAVGLRGGGADGYLSRSYAGTCQGAGS